MDSQNKEYGGGTWAGQLVMVATEGARMRNGDDQRSGI